MALLEVKGLPRVSPSRQRLLRKLDKYPNARITLIVEKGEPRFIEVLKERIWLTEDEEEEDALDNAEKTSMM